MFVDKLRSLARRKAVPEKGDNEELRKSRQKIAEKNERFKKLRGRMEKQDRELDALRAELVEANSARPLPKSYLKDVPVFFIVGRGKSGTTWLEKTLNSHPEVLCLGEGRFFERNFRRMVPPETLREERLKTVQPTSFYGALASSEDLATWIERSVWTEAGRLITWRLFC